MSARVLRIGTRGSKLALAQTRHVLGHLRTHHPQIKLETVTISTSGDSDHTTPLENMGGVGLFTKKIEQELLNGTIDIAVHSAKDLPSETTQDLSIASVPHRESCADVWVSRSRLDLSVLRKGSVVGTGSPRRKAQLLHMRPDLKVNDIRGNIETRLRKLKEGKYDGLIMAHAGLLRCALESHITELLDPGVFVPAAGQGALAVETRTDDSDSTRLVASINDPVSHRCLDMERSVLRKLGAGCSSAVGVYARCVESRIYLSAVVLDRDGRNRLFASQASDLAHDDEPVVDSVIKDLSDRGAWELMGDHE